MLKSAKEFIVKPLIKWAAFTVWVTVILLIAERIK